MASRTVFLIDGTAFCYRAFYAIRGLSTSDGRPSNAVYGFARMLQSLMTKERPDYLAVAFDVGKPTFRHEAFEAYKEHRKPMPEPLIAQLPVVKTLLAAYRVPVFEQPGYEAEDVLATITRQVAGPAVSVYLVTGDKDALQLVDSHVKVYNPHKKEDAVLDAQAVRARYGVGPEQLVDLMALMGDATDNIPNVPGVGEKTASELIQRFGSIEALYKNLDKVEPEGRRETLKRSRAQVEMARGLARISHEAPVSVRLEDLKAQEPDRRELRRLFRDLEFKQLLAELEKDSPAEPPPPGAPIRVERDVEAWLASLKGRPAALGFWWASETGTSAMLALSAGPDAAWVGRIDRALLESREGTRLGEWLGDRRAAKIVHDAKTAKRALARLGAALEGVAGDTMLAAYLLNPARMSQPLTDLADEHLGAPLGEIPAAGDGGVLDGEPPAEPFARHAAAVLELHALLRSKLEAMGLKPLYADLELPLLDVLARMESAGIALDVPYLEGLHGSMGATLQRLTEELYALAGTTFNLNSPKQLGQVLFERLKLRVIKRTKTGPSTDSDVLQQLSADHPLPQKLLQYRELSKLVSTYVDALPKLVDPATGRLHTSFNQAATATGRLSSSEPNLQNIPIKTELGRSIRKAFVPGIPDAVLLAADYTQVELRILAHLSGDEALTQAFREDRDIHRYTASLIYGMPEAEVQPEQRSAMKAINFGILYGMSAHGLSKELGVPHPEAESFIQAYFQRYPGVRAYLDEQIARARRDGYVQTLLGRRRYIPEINSPDPVMRQFGERMAVNAPVQGTAADLIKRAMVDVDEALRTGGFGGRMLLQVHDELVFETPNPELGRFAALVKERMERAIRLDVPVTVTLKAGPNWRDMTPVKP